MALTKVKVIVLLLLTKKYVQTSAQETLEFKLYNDINYGGSLTSARVFTNCTNLDPLVVNAASSVIILGRCGQLYDRPNCNGNTIQISSRSPYLNYLTRWNFEDKTQSVGNCNDPCFPVVGQQHNPNVTFQTTHVTLYSEPEFRGNASSVSVKGCTVFGPKDFPKSIVLPKYGCVLAFWSVFPDDNIKCIFASNYNVLELRDGMPGLNNILHWANVFSPPKQLRALSSCTCKSATGLFTEGLQSLSDHDEKYIILFSVPNFIGEFVKIPLRPRGCINLNETYRGWDVRAQSMYVTKFSCVLVYKEQNCIDYSNLKMSITEPVSYLSYYNLNNTVKSLLACNYTDFVTQTEGKGSNSLVMYERLAISVGCICFTLSLILTTNLVYKKWYAKRVSNVKNKLPEKEITEFIDGLGLELDAARGSDYENVKNNDVLGLPKFSFDLLAQNQPYDYQFEIAKELLNFDSNVPIGSGEYGKVFKGTLKDGDSSKPVAIKTTKAHSNAQSLRSLLKEVKILIYVEKHSNIVALMGCCTTGLREGKLLIVLELCETGSLENYLRANRVNFTNFVQKGNLCNLKHVEQPPSATNLQVQNRLYVQNIPNFNNPISESDFGASIFSVHHLIEWSIEIASGMEYLATKRVIHGDLSARNILLNSEKVCKISDFGLSRKMYSYSQYKKNGEDPLPWRWLAIESLKNLEFSTASDVWSYGILLWEIFTLGEQPYPGVSSLTNNFVHNLEQGLRPTIPPFATSECFNIISGCWDQEPKRRPCFSSLLSSFKTVRCCCKYATKSYWNVSLCPQTGQLSA